MKTVLANFISLLFLFFSFHSFTQFQVGIKAGLNYSDIVMTSSLFDKKPKFGYRFGYQGGVTFSHDLSDKLKIGAEVIYELKRTEALKSYIIASGKIDLQYLCVPVLIYYELFPRMCLAVGPNVSYRLDINITRYKQFPSFRLIWDKNLEIGFNIDAKFYLKNGLYTNVRYNHGFTDLVNLSYTDNFSNTYGGKEQNRSVHLSLGYEFSAGKE